MPKQNIHKMRNYILTPVIISLLTCSHVFSQCNLLFPVDGGSVHEKEVFNKGGKSQGKSQIRVISTENHNDTLIVLSEMTFVDEKGSVYKRLFAPTKCYAGTISVDPFYIFELFPQVYFMHKKETFTGKGYLDYPVKLEIGQKLKDTLMYMQSKNNRGGIAKSEMFIVGRSVSGKEKIKVAAGEYDAFVVESQVNIFNLNDNGKVINAAFTGNVREWITPGTGVVKREIIKGRYLYFYEELLVVKK
jgi:hypothetical protein